MKRVTLLVVLFLSVSGFMSRNEVMAQEKTQQALERAEAPVYQDGDWWEFKVTHRSYQTTHTAWLGQGIYKLARDAGKFKMFDSDRSEVTGYIPSTGTLATMTGSSKRLLDFPVFVGKKWDATYRAGLVGAGSSTYPLSMQVTVVGTEKVTVPAGTFQSFKIEREDVGGPLWHWKWVYYYSPETKSIVKFFFDSDPRGIRGQTEVELIQFGSRGPAGALAR